MYITHATFLHNQCDDIEVLRMAIGDHLYNQHQLLWKLFPNVLKGSSSFLFYRNEVLNNSSGSVIFIIVSDIKPVKTAKYWQLTTKDYAPDLKLGDFFEFRVRVNPTIARKVEGKKHSVRHDVIMNRKMENKKIGKVVSMDQLIFEEGLNWIQSKALKNGFSIDPNKLLIHSYMQHLMSPSNNSNTQKIQLSTLRYDGILKVTDPSLFQSLLFKGIGSAKGFGCGLMLIKRSLV